MAYRPFAVAGTAAPVVVALPLDIVVAVEHIVEGLAVAIAALPPYRALHGQNTLSARPVPATRCLGGQTKPLQFVPL